MSEHEQRADRLEGEADNLQERSERLEEDISATREDWERKKGDPNVPGAAGDPEHAEGDLPPERNVTQQGD